MMDERIHSADMTKPYGCLLIEDQDQLSEAEWDSLRAQDVCLDDWDYMIFLPVSVLQSSPEKQQNYETGEDEWVPGWSPTSDVIQQILHGCCEDHWYVVQFQGQQWALGVAYHA